LAKIINQSIKLNQLIGWSKLRRYLKGLHKNEENSQGGPETYDPLMMFKSVLLGQWHSLSDKQLEESLRVRLDFMLSRENNTSTISAVIGAI
jgi:transposase, IS5 family